MYKILINLAILLFPGMGFAQQIVYYTGQTKFVEVSASEETMLHFPAPPYAMICNPSDVLDLVPVDSLSDFDQASLRRIAGNAKDENKAFDEVGTAKILKLIPLRREQSANCAIRIANGDVLNINFYINPKIMTPAIDFKSIYDRSTVDISAFEGQGNAGIFRELLKGGDLSFLTEITPRKALNYQRKKTPSVDYTIRYAGTDGKKITVWRLVGKVSSDSYKLPQKLEQKNFGQLYFSAFKKAKGGSHSLPLVLSKDEYFYLYIMAGPDVTYKEVLDLL